MTRAMKDSGIVWLGNIPENWELRKWRYILTERNEKNDTLETKEVLSLGYNYGLIPASEKEYSGGNKAREDLTGYKIVRPNDIVMNSMNIVCGSVDISKYTGCVSPVYYAFYTTENEPKYFNYIFKTEQFERSLLGLGNGILIKETEAGKLVSVRLRIPIDKLKPLLLPLPILSEQQKIAEFLNKKCSEIDSVLTKTKESIEEYKLLKNAIITQAVTKGIRPNRKMKDSGIEWIGEIPEEWNIEPLTNRFSFGKGLPITKENLVEKGIPVISYGQIHGKYNPGTSLVEQLFRYVSEEYLNSNPQCLVHKNDLIVADTSEDLDGCGNAAYIDKEMKLFAGYHTVILFAKNKESNKYFSYLLKTDAWRSQIRAGLIEVKLYSVSRKVLKKTNLLIPSQKEQTEIVEYLDKKCSQIDTLIAKKEQLITELETYNKSHIYEYVTGKKEVQ
ncbi:MAG: restriction endonuclease subunit S [Treponema sp.]|nr:restriction endonuclease subunit S [Treponema sp.]